MYGTKLNRHDRMLNCFFYISISLSIPYRISWLSKLSSTKLLGNLSRPAMHEIRSCLFHMWPGYLSKQAKISHFVKMVWLDYRAVIQFLSQESETTTKFHKHLSIVYGKPAPCYATVTSRPRELKRGREDVQDQHYSGRKITQGPEENVQKVHQVVLENRIIGIDIIV